MTGSQRFVLAGAVALLVGLLGASAFNPDTGSIARSMVLWRIFGLTFEIGAPLLFILAILMAVTSAIRGRRSRRDQRQPT